MPLSNFILSPKVLDKEDFFGQLSCAPNTAGNIIIPRKVLKLGYKPILVAYRMAWDGVINNHVTLHLLQDDVKLYPYDNTQVQLAPPEQDVYIPHFIELPQGCAISVTADVDNTPSVNGLVVARVMIAYIAPGDSI